MSEKHKFLRLKKFGPAPHLSRQMSTDAVPCPTIRYPLRSVDQWQIRGKEKNQSCSQPMLWTTCKFQCWSEIRTGHLTLTVPTSITTQPLGLATRADEMKSTKLQPSANCACAILLIDGLGYCMCLLVVSRQQRTESLTRDSYGSRQHARVDTCHSL